jgi:HK97 family phage major capsid protein
MGQRRSDNPGAGLQQPGGQSGGHEQRGPFKSLGEQLQAVIRSSAPGAVIDPRLGQVRAPAGASESVGADGGYLVQTDIAAAVWRKVFETGEILNKVRRIPISSGANGTQINYLKENSRVDGSRWGGVRVYRAAEAASVTASKPAFDKWSLNLEKLMATVYLTDEIMEDASQIEAIVRDVVPQEMAFVLEDEIIRGNGVGRCLGVLEAPCLVSVAKESNQTADTIVPENIVKMRARLHGRSRPNSIWLTNQDADPQLHLMVKTNGTYGVPVYLPAGGLSGNQYDTLYGRPVVPSEYCATVGDKGDIILADFSQYVLIEKGGINVASSIHVQFLFGESVLRFTWRNNGRPLWAAPLTPYKGSNTQSPFVTLDAR